MNIKTIHSSNAMYMHKKLWQKINTDYLGINKGHSILKTLISWENYRESSNSTVFGTQKKPYWWKFVLLEFLWYKFIKRGFMISKVPFFHKAWYWVRLFFVCLDTGGFYNWMPVRTILKKKINKKSFSIFREFFSEFVEKIVLIRNPF